MKGDDYFKREEREFGVSADEVRQSMKHALDYARTNGLRDEDLLMWVWRAGAIYGRDHLTPKEGTP